MALLDDLEQRPVGDPEKTFVILMCAYALDVLTGILPGPYIEADATPVRARSRRSSSNAPNSTYLEPPGRSAFRLASCAQRATTTDRPRRCL